MKLHAEEHGDGPPVLLLNGLGYASWAWQRQIPALSGRFRLIAVDNRGTGRSPKPPGPYSLEEMADEAAEVLDGRRAHVLGYSMGGYLAQLVALRHPELTDHLVLISTGTGGPGHVPLPDETAAAWREHAGRPPADFARATMHLSFRPGWTDEHPEEYDALLASRLEHPTPPHAWQAQFDAATRFVAERIPIEEIAAPTLVLHGTADRIVPYENGLRIAERIPGAELVTFEGGGHLLFLEEAKRLNAVVERFLAG